MRRTTSTSRIGSESGHASDARSLHPRRSGHSPRPHDQTVGMAGLESEISAGITAMAIHSGNSAERSEKSPVARESPGNRVATAILPKVNRVPRAHPPHPAARPSSPSGSFLETCFLCRKRLRLGTDIFMYRGDEAFCSIECRSHQIEADEREDNHRIASVKKGTGAPVSNPTSDAAKVSSPQAATAV